MNLLVNAYQAAEDYYDQLPQNSGNCLLTSFGASFVLRTVFSQDPKVGLICGTLSATATAIYILISPIFLHLTNGQNQLNGRQEFCRAGLAFIGSACLITACISNLPLDGPFSRINLYKEIFNSMAVHCIRIWAGNVSMDAREANWLFSTFPIGNLLDISLN